MIYLRNDHSVLQNMYMYADDKYNWVELRIWSTEIFISLVI